MPAQPQQTPLKGSVQVTIKPQKTLQDVIDLNGGDEWWTSLPDNDRGEVAQQYRTRYLDPELEKNNVQGQDREEILGQFNQKYGVTPQAPQQPQAITPQQGLQNLFGSYQQGVNNFGNAVLNPQTYTGLAQQAGNAVQTELQNRMAPPKDLGDAVFKGFNSTPLALAPGALNSIRDLGQGALSLPADIVNAYEGKQVYQPAVQLPEVFNDIRSQYPVSSFIGEQLPFAVPFGEAAQAGKAGSLLKSIGEGAAIGALNNPQGGGLPGRISNAAMGATVPAALGVAARPFNQAPKKYSAKNYQSKVTPPSEGLQRFLRQQNVAERSASAEQRALGEMLDRIRTTQKLTPEGTRQSQLTQYDSLHGKLSQTAVDKQLSPQERAVYGKVQGRVKEEAAPLQKAKEQAATKKQQDSDYRYQQRRMDRKQDKVELANLKTANKIKTLEAQIAGRERLIASNTASAAEKAKATKDLASHKAQLTAAIKEQDYRNKEALLSKKQSGQAAKKAAPKQQNAGGRMTLNPAKKAGNVERVAREKQLPGLEALKNEVEIKRRPELIAKAEKSYLSNEKVKLDYRAEKYGTEIDKPTSDGVVITGIKQAKKDGSVYLTAVDSEGQFRSYKVFDGKGDSLLNDIKPTGKKSDFEVVLDNEDPVKGGTGRQRVLNKKTNELTEIFKPGETRKTSELEADSAKIQAYHDQIADVATRLKSGETVSKREIVNAGKAVDEATFKKHMEELTQEKLNEVGEQTGC